METIAIQKSGFVTMSSILSSVVDDLSSNGFTIIYDGRGGDNIVTLEASLDVDPLQYEQPWRIRFDIDYIRQIQKANNKTEDPLDSLPDGRTLGQVIVGTPLQLESDGSAAAIPNPAPTPPGSLYPDVIVGEISSMFKEDYISNARPCSYVLSITNRGFNLSITTDAEDEGRGQFWMCVQRLVNAVTGKTKLDNHSPVICFYFKERDEQFQLLTDSRDPENPIYSSRYIGIDNHHVRQIVVRESDVHAPTIPTVVSSFDNYSGKSINIVKQISMNHNNKYSLVIPDQINTHRHLYHNDRMDIIAYISANVVPENLVADINMHGEATITFSQGSVEIDVGDTIVGSLSSSKAVVHRVDISTGDWATSDADGVLHVKQLDGDFFEEDVIAYNELGLPSGQAHTLATTLTYRKYQAQRCSGGNELVEDGYVEGSRILFLVENGDI